MSRKGKREKRPVWMYLNIGEFGVERLQHRMPNPQARISLCGKNNYHGESEYASNGMPLYGLKQCEDCLKAMK